MLKGKKSRALSTLVVIALVVSMLPIGALAALADSTNVKVSSSTSNTVILGTGDTSTTMVLNQTAGSITIEEETGSENSFPTVDTSVVLNLPDHVFFAKKPTVTYNGATITNGALSSGANVFTFTVNGRSDEKDKIVVSDVSYDVGAADSTSGLVTVAVTDPEGDAQNVNNAKLKGGLKAIAADASTKTSVEPGENMQDISDIEIIESAAGIAKADSKITVTLPDGFTWYAPPIATVDTPTAAFDLKNESSNEVAGTLSDDRKSATWDIDTISTSGGYGFTIEGDDSVNVVSTAAGDTDIKVAVSSSDTGVGISPASLKVGKTSAGDSLTLTAASIPSIAKSANQAAGDVTLTEKKKETLDADTFTMTLPTGVTFASTPKATPTGGLKLEDSAGNAVTTAVSGTLNSAKTIATWEITDQSTADGATLVFTGIALNVASTVSNGNVKASFAGNAIDDTLTVNVANVSATANVTVAASGTPAIKINTADQAAGDITITETKAGAITDSDADSITLKIFGVSSDNEILFAELPTVTVVSGDIEVNATVFKGGTDYTEVQIDISASTKASVIKISGIKYDVNAKAVEGSVQLVVGNGGTRLASVSNATISKTGNVFSDVAGTHWAASFISKLSAKGIIGGYTDGTFKPDNTITRAEFAKIAVEAATLTLVTTDTASFSDVATGHWAFKYIETAKKAAIIGGYADGTFKPDAKITRAEISKIIVEAAKYTIDTTGAGFSDTAGHWAESYIKTAAKNGVVGGYPDGTFKPNSNATRAEASKMVSTWLKL